MQHKASAFRILIFTLVSALFMGGCTQKNPTWQLLDADTRLPVEGALVFEAGSHHVYRSDRGGEVTLNLENPDSTVSIHARNYTKIKVLPSEVKGIILLDYNERRVSPSDRELVFTKKDSLRGSYGPFRENNDLLFYGLSVRLDPEKKYLTGHNIIKFAMLKSDTRIQIDLFENMNVDLIMFDDKELKFEREFNAVFVDFPEKLKRGNEYTIDFYYSGYPLETGRFGGLVFKEDSLGNPWIYTANQGIGASLWWPNKDQQRDEVDSMTISITIPSDLVSASNGRFQGKEDLDDGYTRYNWKVHYPINNYSVSLNIAKYVHYSEMLDDLTLDYYVLPYHLDGAKRQFAQVKPMIECYQNFFGPYPFPLDGFKLIEVPYSGMEHQSAVTYGNMFKNGYLGRDWTGVGISMKFDFIIIHESGHEWFGNSVTANDVSDAWIQEGWDTYAEGVYVECLFGYEDAMKYINGYREKVRNRESIVGPTAVNYWPTSDQYFKGALFLNTLRHVVDDDTKWWALIKDYTAHFQYRNIWTTDVINYFNDYLGMDMRPIFEQYLYNWKIPILQFRFTEKQVEYQWKSKVEDFNMPVKVRTKSGTHTIYPTAEWQSEAFESTADDEWTVLTDLFYVNLKNVTPTSNKR